MATNWVLGKISDALAPTVSNAMSSAGSVAGGAMNTLGNSINGVGEGINNSIRRYGDGAKDYGNSIMDWTKSPVSRAQTAANPLGLTGSTTQGKRSVTDPRMYHAPAKSKTPSKTLMTTSKSAGTEKKVIDAPKRITAPTGKPVSQVPKPSTPASKGPIVKSSSGPSAPSRSAPRSDAPLKPVTGVKTSMPTKTTGPPSKPAVKGPAKQVPGSAKASSPSTTQTRAPTKQASNPLGLTWD